MLNTLPFYFAKFFSNLVVKYFCFEPTDLISSSMNFLEKP